MASTRTIAHYSNPKNHWVVVTQQADSRVRGGWEAVCVCGSTTRGHTSEAKAKAAWREHLPAA